MLDNTLNLSILESDPKRTRSLIRLSLDGVSTASNRLSANLGNVELRPLESLEVYEITLLGPLIVRCAPALPTGEGVSDLVQSALCIAPTIPGAYGIEAPKLMEDKDLTRIAKGKDGDTARSMSVRDCGLPGGR